MYFSEERDMDAIILLFAEETIRSFLDF